MFQKLITKLLRSMSFVMFVVMIVVVFAQVMMRYFFSAPLAWSDELSRLLLVWVAFMGVALVHFSDAGHPAITFLVDKLHGRKRLILDAVLNLLLIVCFIAVAYVGWKYTIRNYRFRSPVLHYRNSFKYAVFPVAIVLMALKSMERFVADIRMLFKDSDSSEVKE